MDATAMLPSIESAPPRDIAPTLLARRSELILDAVRTALADPREHRLFRTGKFSGLFPARGGSSGEAALLAFKEGLFETTRTEARGKLIVEWVKATDRAVDYLHDRESPKAVLGELRDALGETRAGLPVWLAEVRGELAGLAAQFHERAGALERKLTEIGDRVEAALRRYESQNWTIGGHAATEPWAIEALEHLDRRKQCGLPGECPLAELHRAVRRKHPELTIAEFHEGLLRLNDARAIRLAAGTTDGGDAEYALLVGHHLCGVAIRDRAG